jgi:hypothetical protein
MHPMKQFLDFVVSHVAAFVTPAVSNLLQSSSGSTTTLLDVPLKDYQGAALSFFTNVRVPAALIAGTSVGSLFSLVKLVNSEKHGSPFQSWLLKVYHILCLATLILSLNVVVTATAASTTLLLGDHVGMATSAYEFLNREIRYEFVTTRWSYLMANLLFIAGITTRAVLEFELLNANRRRFAVVVVLTMTALLTHLLSYVNSTLHCWDSLIDMTFDVIKLIVGKAIRGGSPLETISVACFVGTALVAVAPNAWFVGRLNDAPVNDVRGDTAISSS